MPNKALVIIDIQNDITKNYKGYYPKHKQRRGIG